MRVGYTLHNGKVRRGLVIFYCQQKKELVRMIDIMGRDLMGSAKKKKRSGDPSSLSRTRH